ncbi:hypothetical protein RGU11_10640 [Rossellomorea marisflavi]|jgi:hypothetical protein|nr:hypothetical protein [Rossellomorea marisflavi]MDR4936835.1 hypothetical protein [Rossellomorea marisflavi]
MGTMGVITFCMSIAGLVAFANMIVLSIRLSKVQGDLERLREKMK